MKYLVLKELPQGQQPGATIDVHEDIGNILEQVGAVRKVTEVEDDGETDRPRRRYQRRDLAATTH